MSSPLPVVGLRQGIIHDHNVLPIAHTGPLARLLAPCPDPTWEGHEASLVKLLTGISSPWRHLSDRRHLIPSPKLIDSSKPLHAMTADDEASELRGCAAPSQRAKLLTSPIAPTLHWDVSATRLVTKTADKHLEILDLTI